MSLPKSQTICPPKPQTLRFVFSRGPIQRQIHRNLKGSRRKTWRLPLNQPPNPVGQPPNTVGQGPNTVRKTCPKRTANALCALTNQQPRDRSPGTTGPNPPASPRWTTY